MGRATRCGRGGLGALPDRAEIVAEAGSPGAEALQLRDESSLAGGALDVRGCSAGEHGECDGSGHGRQRAEKGRIRRDEPLAGDARLVELVDVLIRGDGECRTIPEPGGVT